VVVPIVIEFVVYCIAITPFWVDVTDAPAPRLSRRATKATGAIDFGTAGKGHRSRALISWQKYPGFGVFDFPLLRFWVKLINARHSLLTARRHDVLRYRLPCAPMVKATAPQRPALLWLGDRLGSSSIDFPALRLRVVIQYPDAVCYGNAVVPTLCDAVPSHRTIKRIS